jgi:septal ring-binding cell division protein DamX
MAALDDWQYLGNDLANLSDDKLVEYKDIDAQFDQAFAAKAKSLGGRGNYKRIFGLAQSEADYKLREVRKYEPKLLRKQIDSEQNSDSASKAIVFQRYNRSGEPQRLGFFSRKVKKPSSRTKPVKKSAAKAQQMVSQQQPKQSNQRTSVLVNSNETDQTRFGKLSGDSFTLQILQSNNPSKIKRISQKASGVVDKKLYFLSANKNNRPIYLVTYGTYENKEQAKNAAKSLPQYVAIGTPWIRKISKIQQQIAKL